MKVSNFQLVDGIAFSVIILSVMSMSLPSAIANKSAAANLPTKVFEKECNNNQNVPNTQPSLSSQPNYGFNNFANNLPADYGWNVRPQPHNLGMNSPNFNQNPQFNPTSFNQNPQFNPTNSNQNPQFNPTSLNRIPQPYL